LAHIYFITGQYKKAIREAKRSLVINPDSTISSFLLSLIYVQLGENKKMEKELQKMFAKPGNFEKIIKSLGKILNNRLSREIYSQKLSHMGIVLIADKFTSEAETILKLAIGINPKNVYPYLNLAHIYIKEKRFVKAIAVLEQAENKGFMHPNIFYNKAVIYYAQKNYGKAKSYLIKTLDIKSNHAYAKHLLNLIKGQK